MFKKCFVKDLNINNNNKIVTVAGWIKKIRSHSHVCFIELRDSTGIIQVVVKNIELIKYLKQEDIITVSGTLYPRNNKNINLYIDKGDIEIIADKLELLSSSKPPFDLNDDISDITNLEHRPYSLRKDNLQHNIRIRHKILQSARQFLDTNGFVEIETPILAKSSPEGARDYIVPSRLHKGSFFALPQSPQIYKQMLMCSGFERYYQIARSFRDEDLRSDRQPEFTQIDIEMSFVDQENVKDIVSKLICNIYKNILDIELDNNFKQISYLDCIKKYGCDKPDLRIPIDIKEQESYLTIQCDYFTQADQLEYNYKVLDNNIIFYTKDKSIDSYNELGDLIKKVGKILGFTKKLDFIPIWVNNFPVLDTDENGNIVSKHNIFSDYIGDVIDLNTISKSYDLVINGYELCSGSIRINDYKKQVDLLNYLNIQTDSFKGLLKSLEYGIPPHGGVGIGLERLVMLIVGTENIKDVVAFPKTQSTSCLTTNSPSKINKTNIDELGISIKE